MEEREGDVRRLIERGALEVVGEGGYRALTVQKIVEKTGVSRARFYRTFANKHECFTAAFAAEADRLTDRLISAAQAQPDWIGAFDAALLALADYLQKYPLRAAGLLQVHVAGGAATTKRNELFGRLSRAVDSARRENMSRHSPPPVTAEFILNTIEAAVTEDLSQQPPGRSFSRAIPDLEFIALTAYFGPEHAKSVLRG